MCLFLAGALFPPAEANAWLSDYSNRKTITIDASTIDEDLDDFPVYIDIDGDTDLGSTIQDTTNYYDIRFTDSADSVLPYEEEAMSISGGSATGSYWVKSDLASTTGATIYMYYGKSGDTDGSRATSTWNSGFEAVWHLSEGDNTASDFYKDSTDNDNDGTLTDADGDLTSTTTQLATGLDFTGDEERISVTDNSSLDLGSTFTLSGWVNMDDFTELYSFIIAKDAIGGSSYDLGFASNGQPYAAINDGVWAEYIADGTLVTDSWHHIAAVRNSSDQLVLYVDGNSTSTFSSVKTPQNSSANVTLGLRSGADYEYDGTLDEVRIESVARSAAWMKFVYANSGGESDYELSFGSEQDNASPAVASFSPLDGGTNISVSSNLIITFDEAVDTESGNITLKKISDDSTVETFDVTSDISGSGTTEITIDPTSDLATGVHYYVQIDSTAFDDTSGNSFAGISDTTTWNFSVEGALAQTSDGGGNVLGLYESTLPYQGPGHVYIEPQNQTIYPDGTVIFHNTTALGSPGTSSETNEIPTPSTENETESEQYIFTRNLRRGMTGQDIKQLQRYLNNNGFILAESDHGSPGNETTYFGPRTWDALVRYQESHIKDILHPLNLKQGTGYFGPYTRKHANENYN